MVMDKTSDNSHYISSKLLHIAEYKHLVSLHHHENSTRIDSYLYIKDASQIQK